MSKRRLPGPAGMSGLVSLWVASSLIKSIQSWSTSYTGTSGTAAINAVDVNNSILIFNGFNANDGSAITISEMYQRAALTNSTTVTVSRGSVGNAGARQGRGIVLEFAPGIIKSIQYVTQSGIGGTATPLTISGVDLAKAILLSLGYEGTNANTGGQYTGPRMYFNSATQVIMGFDGGSALADTTGGAVIVELF